MHPFHVMLMLFAAAALLGFALAVRWERRKFLARGLTSSWFKVRLASLPAALLVAALVVVPARSTSGRRVSRSSICCSSPQRRWSGSACTGPLAGSRGRSFPLPTRRVSPACPCCMPRHLQRSHRFCSLLPGRC